MRAVSTEVPAGKKREESALVSLILDSSDPNVFSLAARKVFTVPPCTFAKVCLTELQELRAMRGMARAMRDRGFMEREKGGERSFMRFCYIFKYRSV